MNSIAPPEVLHINGVTIVRPGADYSNLFESLLDRLAIVQDLAASVNPPRLLMDMQHVRFIGSAFLGRMVQACKTLSARDGGQLGLCNLSAFCSAAFSTAKLDSMIPQFKTLDDAVLAMHFDPPRSSGHGR